MAWCEYSAEAIDLDTKLRTLHKQGKTTEALAAITAALRKASEVGPSLLTYEQFERRLTR